MEMIHVAFYRYCSEWEEGAECGARGGNYD